MDSLMPALFHLMPAKPNNGDLLPTEPALQPLETLEDQDEEDKAKNCDGTGELHRLARSVYINLLMQLPVLVRIVEEFCFLEAI